MVQKLFVLTLISLFLAVQGSPPAEKARTPKRINLPFLGIGARCGGCPEHFCDDDPAIVHGYCCGCARFYDNLPVRCSLHLKCPPNIYDLCEDYEYMMHCCCE